MKTRRIFSVFLCAVMIMTMIPAFSITASAASATEISDINALKTALEA